FTPGETTATIAVSTVADAVDEPDETVFVELSSPSGASVGDGRAVVTIRDDDQVPSVSIGDAAVSEGSGGTTSVTLAVTLSNPSASAIRVDFATVPGTASAGPDYTSASGTLSFPAGATTASVSVGVAGDTVIEPTETFSVVLSNASNASIGDGRGTVTIRDDDGSTPRVLGQSPSTRESSSRLSRLWPGRKTSIEGSAAAIPRASGS
ncbi:MAG: Calx-beta domain-containing protein, partial [Actinomycetota bacterium]